MSKLSIHISHSPTGLGSLLKKCYDAKSPVGILYSVNQNLSGTIKENSPTTKWIYRRQTEMFNRLPNNFWNDDPAISATKWLNGDRDPADKNRTQLENILLNKPDYADSINEPAIEIADYSDSLQIIEAVRRAKYLNLWTITCLEIAHTTGVKLAIFSFPTESPLVDKRIWNELIPAMRLGKKYGAILSLHAYGTVNKLSDNKAAYLRHQEIYKLLPEDAKLPIVYSECGAGNGYDTGLDGQAYIDDLAICDQEWMKDSNILGACSFQLGVGTESNMAEIMPIYGDYIANHPTQEIIVGEPRVDYARTVNVIPANATEARAVEIFLEGWRRSKESCGASYDDGGIGNLTSRTVNLYDIPLNRQQEFIDFYNQYYPGVAVSFFPKT